mgnify:CR=1 FL=1
MAKYFGKRLVIGLITLFALATITFFLMHAIPGSPFAGETSKLPANVKEKLVEQYGLDKPVTEQYVRYLQNAVKGDFGTSLNRKGKAVSDIIMAGIPYTASLGLAAFFIALAVGILLGTISAFSKHQWVNNTVCFYSNNWCQCAKLFAGAAYDDSFRSGASLSSNRRFGHMASLYYAGNGTGAFSNCDDFSSYKTSLTEVMRQDYMVLAKSKGTGQVMVIIRHALKNALVPVVTYAGPLLATLLTGSFVVETLFSVPGIGAEFVTSVSNRDYTMIMALTIFYGAFIIICNIVTDLITALMDPRIRLK